MYAAENGREKMNSRGIVEQQIRADNFHLFINLSNISSSFHLFIFYFFWFLMFFI